MRRRAHSFIPADERDIVAHLPVRQQPASILARLAAGSCQARPELVGGSNREGGSGGGLGFFLEVGGDFVKASSHRRYQSLRLALSREWQDELRRQRLGIYHPERTWFLSRDPESQYWACSLTPTLVVLRDRFNASSRHGPDWECWKQYLDAFEMTFDLVRREAVLLDCNPNNFGLERGRLYYVDDDLADRHGRLPFGHQVLLRLREYEHGELSLRERFLSEFVDLVEGFLDDERLRRDLLEDFEPQLSWPREPGLQRILERLVGRLRSSRRRPG